jgi:hypothetical protein
MRVTLLLSAFSALAIAMLSLGVASHLSPGEPYRDRRLLLLCRAAPANTPGDTFVSGGERMRCP